MRLIGRYEIRGLLGRGGMSAVYKVAMPVTGKIVALKLLAPGELLLEMVGRAELERLFRVEAVTMARINHPHIADVWDYDEHQGRPFFVMEYFCTNLGLCIGEHFMVEEPSRPLEVEKVFLYGQQILAGLFCLHQAGIVHRDLKPYNILITEQDTVKIADFGMSKLHNERFPDSPNVRVGSPYYSAPEQEREPESADRRADLYSMGVMLFRMLTGRLPMVGENQGFGATDRVLAAEWHDFFTQALARDPEARYQDARQMSQALTGLEELWHGSKQAACRFYRPAAAAPSQPRQPERPRHQPVKIAPPAAAKLFGLDQLWRPLTCTRNDFEARGEIIIDHATGLAWQQGGSDFHLNWPAAQAYIAQLNETAHGGFTTWRLPTVNELVTLISPRQEIDDYCIAPLFDRAKKWLWSADRRSFVAAWYVGMDLGFVGRQDFTCLLFARGVCSLA